MLLPLERDIEEEKKAAAAATATGPSDLSTLSLDELLERNALMRERILELRDVPATSVDAPPESSPIVAASDPTPASVPESPPLETTTTPGE